MKINSKFRLIGNTTEFRAVALPMVAGFIPSVIGHTLDGKRQTTARIADVIELACEHGNRPGDFCMGCEQHALG